MTVNSFGGAVGHVNVTLTDEFGESTTYGANVGQDYPDGVREEYNEGKSYSESDPIPLTADQFEKLSSYAQDSADNPTGYNLVKNNCVDFGDRMLQQVGYPPGSIAGFVDPGLLATLYAQSYKEMMQDPGLQHSGILDPNNPNDVWQNDGGATMLLTFLGGPGVPGGVPAWGMGDPLHPPPWDPIVIDLNGNGLELSAARTSTVHFDLNGDGFAEQVSWVGANDGILFHDDNANGAVDGAGEFFGNALQDGFQALAALDSNHDGIIDAQDTSFSTLKIWQDLNQDGATETGEVRTLSAAGVHSISLATVASDAVIGGSRIGFTTSVTMEDGSTKLAGSAYLDSERLLSTWQPPAGFSLSTLAQELPNLTGYGDVKDLRAAVTLDSGLAQQVEDFVNNAGAMSGSQLRAEFEDILYKWAGVDDVDPLSRGPAVDAQHLEVLEHLYATSFSQLIKPTGITVTDPPDGTAQGIERAYSTVFDAMFDDFMQRVPVSEAILGSENFPDTDMFAEFVFGSGLDAIPAMATALNFVATVADEQGGLAGARTIDRDLSLIRGEIISHFNGDQTEVFALGGNAASTMTLSNLGPYYQAVLQAWGTGGVSYLGDTGNNTILAGSGRDVLYGGLGADSMDGGNGNDSYFWWQGDGADTINEGWINGDDTLNLVGVNPADVVLVRSGTDVTLQIAPSALGGDGGSIKLLSSVWDGQHGVEHVVFADGTSWSQADMQTMLLTQAETPGADTIIGFSSADTITGGAGNDSMDGGVGNDTYFWSRGDGSDTINEQWLNGDDTLHLVGVNPADVVLVRSGLDVTLQIAPSALGGDGGSVKLLSSLVDGQHGVEHVVFADGTSWSLTDMQTMLLAQASTGGNDTITGFGGADTITGGAGSDSMDGSTGNDIYVWSRGDGADTISEGWLNGDDTLHLVGVNPADVVLVRSGSDVTLQIAPSGLGGDGGSVKLLNSLADDQHGVEHVVFADGTSWSLTDLQTMLLARAETPGADTIVGFGVAETITGGAGNDSMDGGGGNDTYIWTRGDGSDTISEGQTGGASDTLVLQGVSAADVLVIRNGSDITLQIGPSATGGADGGAIKLLADLDEINGQGVDQIVLSDATWTRADFRTMTAPPSTPGNDSLVGTGSPDVLGGGGGNDTILGGGSTDLITGGAGNDSMDGGVGNDPISGRAATAQTPSTSSGSTVTTP